MDVFLACFLMTTSLSLLFTLRISRIYLSNLRDCGADDGVSRANSLLRESCQATSELAASGRGKMPSAPLYDFPSRDLVAGYLFINLFNGVWL
ncbi:hypothetical protein [Nitrosospira briensis]|uniref:hypothetical protein n=1 Tax=Nitrosospira briensis TaxID=35799 RepID=UPI0009456E85|nr:hypothetical protein [Nitrosospira briensis]